MPTIDSMSKQELADYALTLGVTLSTEDTKAQMIEQFNAQITPEVAPEVAPEVTPEVAAPPSADTLFAEAQARNAEEARIAALPVDEQVELVQWTVEEAIGILRYAVSRGKDKKPFFQEDKILNLINSIEESIQY